MIVADTSALISLATADALQAVVEEFDVQTSELVVSELETTAEYDDVHGDGATTVLEALETIVVHETENSDFETSRIDAGEASCLSLTRSLDATFLITDDLRALPELQNLTTTRVAISPIVLRALVKRGVLTNEEARTKLERLATTRDWLGRPIYRRAIALFES